jgi:3-hydroxyacyl-[acyl-carrier protein] dehydratase/trans-2-decenoyl-[acyl-carrier protein] isomerase
MKQDLIELDKLDLNKLYNKEHEWHKLLVEKYDLPSSSELPSLPQPYMLAFDKATLSYAEGTGKYGKGYAEAELDVSVQNPWFWCHFLGDPVMPGSQGLDGFLQLTGTWAFFSGEIYGRARALDGSYNYTGQILPIHKKVFYRMDVNRFLKKKRLLYFDGHIAVDSPDNIIYTFGVGKVGFFTKAELSIPDLPVSAYYLPDWNKLKQEAVSWIENAERFYNQSNEL